MVKRLLPLFLLLLAVAYIITTIFLPFMEPLRYNLFAWLLFFIYMINVVFVYSVLNNKDKNSSVTDEEKKDIKISQELFRDRSKWHV